MKNPKRVVKTFIYLTMRRLNENEMTQVQCGFNWNALNSLECASCGVGLAEACLTIGALYTSGGLSAIGTLFKKNAKKEVQKAILQAFGITIPIVGSVLACIPCAQALGE